LAPVIFFGALFGALFLFADLPADAAFFFVFPLDRPAREAVFFEVRFIGFFFFVAIVSSSTVINRDQRWCLTGATI
jgi:hypothetical protein